MVISEAILCGSCRAFAISCSRGHSCLGLAAGWHVGQHVWVRIVGVPTHLVVPAHVLNIKTMDLL